MTDEMRAHYDSYVRCAAEMKRLKEIQDKDKAAIKKYHADTHRDVIEEDGFKSQIVRQTTTSLDRELLQAKFGVGPVNECLTTTEKTNFRLERMLLG